MKTYMIGVDIFPFALGSNMVPPGSLGSCLDKKFWYSVHYGFLQVILIFESTALVFILITEFFWRHLKLYIWGECLICFTLISALWLYPSFKGFLDPSSSGGSTGPWSVLGGTCPAFLLLLLPSSLSFPAPAPRNSCDPKAHIPGPFTPYCPCQNELPPHNPFLIQDCPCEHFPWPLYPLNPFQNFKPILEINNAESIASGQKIKSLSFCERWHF